ncbi:hypothetical protein LTR24_008120 [Lithohypha guttulata]|uniref:Uncharacterized protein n=1 Tax=Lithohypha guttulata TaxID=1690604 RepID=A0ABR0K1K0_9EURO|nr:hypothetical protein LTR24_008120 [Lithohypha guttulata]
MVYSLVRERPFLCHEYVIKKDKSVEIRGDSRTHVTNVMARVARAANQENMEYTLINTWPKLTVSHL